MSDNQVIAVSRPVVRYHGGKWRLAPWVIKHLPAHDIYIEPFGGAASVLLRKPASRFEVYNDLNSEMVNVFRVLRNDNTAQRLAALLRATPCSLEEFIDARTGSNDPIEQARRTIVLGHQGHGSTGSSGGKLTGWRRGFRERGTSSAKEWAEIWQQIEAWADRMRHVYIEKAPAIEVIKRWDKPSAVHYVDPPYLAETRSSESRVTGYAHEMTTEDHVQLAEVLHACRGAVVLSGYPSPLYDRLFEKWERVDKLAMADHGRSRTECLWIKPYGSMSFASVANFSQTAIEGIK